MYYVARRLDDEGPDSEGAHTVFDSPVGCSVDQTAGKLNPSVRQITCDAASYIVHAHRLPGSDGFAPRQASARKQPPNRSGVLGEVFRPSERAG